MARREVTEVICDRCKRVETQAQGDRPKIIGGGSYEFKISLLGDETAYEDLCVSCRKTLVNYHSKIIKAKMDPPAQKPTPRVASVPTGSFNRSKAAG